MQRNILILAVLLLLILGAILFLIWRSNRVSYTGPKSLENLSIKQITPADQAQNVAIFTPIKVIFNRPLTKEEQNSITVSAEPQFDAQGGWSDDSTTFSFTPTKPLQEQQKYLLTVYFGPHKYLWEFTTVPIEKASMDDQIKAQEQADRNYGEWSRQVDENYPWYNNLPLKSATYFVYFDLDRKQFVADLYPKTSSSTSVNDQVESMKKEILDKLRNLGIDTSIYQFDWQIKPEP